MIASTDRETGDAAPVFVVGCGRSGTTLLRLMLDAHPLVAIPGESHFIYLIARMRARGRWPASIAGERNRQRLIDYLEGLNFHHEWGLPFDKITETLKAPDITSHGSAFQALFERYRATRGKPIWGDKTPMHVQYMLLLDRLIPGCRFIHLIRDARPVAQSLMTRVWGPRNIATAGYYWKWLVLSGMLGGAYLGPDRYKQMTFESLVTDNESQLRALTDWLDIPFDPKMQSYHDTDSARTYGGGTLEAKRLSTPLDAGRLTFWKNKLSTSEQKSLARQAGGLLAYLGYEVEDLPASALREKDRIKRILSPEFMNNVHHVLDDCDLPPPGPLGAQVSRFQQYADFMLGRLEPWARNSLRWQRDVAAMLK